MESKKLTMNDIAKMAGVGKSTVSRYFNGGYVKPETKEKIRLICEEYNYQPNQVAKMLKAKRTNMVGIITPTLTSNTSSRTITVMDEYLQERGFRTIIMNTNHSEQREQEAFAYLSELNVDGVVILATNTNYNVKELKKKYSFPILFMGQRVEGMPSVIYDDYLAGYYVGKKVTDYGHTDIALIGVNESDHAVGYIRKKGIKDGLKEHGIVDYDYVEVDFEYETCFPIIDSYLRSHIPSAIICSTDTMAIACYNVLKNLGQEIPKDVSLIGFGSYRYSNLLNPPLESIRFHNSQAGEICGQLIIELIEGVKVNDCTVIRFELIEGKSVRKI
ncbi:MAG: LacI family DNA-binding transcriptional regulator [Bacillota bacterium]|nr:LacI family DNA-binding transcriptional regulator [Bacillota bacterium]